MTTVHDEEEHPTEYRAGHYSDLGTSSLIHGPHEAKHHHRHYRSHDHGGQRAVGAEHCVVEGIDELVHQEEHDEGRCSDYRGEAAPSHVHHLLLAFPLCYDGVLPSVYHLNG